MPLRINEIFYSIQGESSHAGWPCAFIRLSGCNLRCAYCDTRYAYDDGSDLAIPDILDSIRIYGCNLVEVTGGEPLIQEDTPKLVRSLIDSGYTVLLETNGSMDIRFVDSRCIRIVDFKCPSSGEAGSNDFGNMTRLTDRDEVKCVIGTRMDYEFARNIAESISRDRDGRTTIHFSPVFGMLPPRTLVEWILRDRLHVRLNLQIHKCIWDPDQRGV